MGRHDLAHCSHYLENLTFKEMFSADTIITRKELIDNYVQTLGKAHKEYMWKIANANKYFEENAMDIIKITKYIEQAPVTERNKVTPADSRKLFCIVPNCGIHTFKLKRHLENTHKQLNKEMVTYCIKMANVLKVNAKENEDEPAMNAEKEELKKNRANKFQNTKLVNRKNNYKKCIECHKLVMNISDHVLKTHKVLKSDKNYKNMVHNAPVVNKICTKVVDGKVTELQGEELKDVLDKFSEKMEIQQDNLTNLKTLRHHIRQLQESILIESDVIKKKELIAQLKSINEEFKSARYRDTTNYSTKCKQWKVAFFDYLNSLGDSEPKRGAKIAISIIHDYNEKYSKETVYEDLMNAKFIENVMKDLCDQEKLNSTTKIKYIRKFHQFIKFVTSNCNSPERKENLTYEEMLRKEVNCKEVNEVIETFVSKLSKNRGKYIFA